MAPDAATMTGACTCGDCGAVMLLEYTALAEVNAVENALGVAACIVLCKPEPAAVVAPTVKVMSALVRRAATATEPIVMPALGELVPHLSIVFR